MLSNSAGRLYWFCVLYHLLWEELWPKICFFSRAFLVKAELFSGFGKQQRPKQCKHRIVFLKHSVRYRCDKHSSLSSSCSSCCRRKIDFKQPQFTLLGRLQLFKLLISLCNIVMMKLLERLFNLQPVSERYWCSGVGREDLRLAFCLHLSDNLHYKLTMNGKLALTEAIPLFSISVDGNSLIYWSTRMQCLLG